MGRRDFQRMFRWPLAVQLYHLLWVSHFYTFLIVFNKQLCVLNLVQLCGPGTVVHQAPLSGRGKNWDFSKHEYWSISFSRAPSWTQGSNPCPCFGWWILYHWVTREILEEVFKQCQDPNQSLIRDSLEAENSLEALIFLSFQGNSIVAPNFVIRCYIHQLMILAI